METIFAVCPPNLEDITVREIEEHQLTSASIKKEFGGVEFAGDLQSIYQANLQLRTANRILVRFGNFRAAAFPQLVRRTAQLPWEKYLRPGQPIQLRVTCKKSRLYHSDAVAQRIARAIFQKLGKTSNIVKASGAEGKAAQLIVVRLMRDQCTISIDSSGAALHQRGYRGAAGKAPLRETLAAAMLFASGWDRQTPLVDPFCGSGTIPIEAAMLAANIAPGLHRSFQFMQWPIFDSATWQTVHGAAENQMISDHLPLILGSDRDAGVIAAAEQNAQKAGVAEQISFGCHAVSATNLPDGACVIVGNPPYGKRISGNKDLRNLYAKFGQLIKAHEADVQVTLLSDSEALLRSSGLGLKTIAKVDNGGINVLLAVTKEQIPKLNKKNSNKKNSK